MLFFSDTLKAQNEVLVPIVNHQVFNLHSRSSLFFSGNYASVIELELPENTTRWYYRFYNVNRKDLLSQYTSNASLLEEVKENMKDPQNSKITFPPIPNTYQNKVSIYLLNDSAQTDVFNKRLTFSKVQYQDDFSVLNEASGWMEVCSPGFLSGKQYLGLLNKATVSESFIVLDVLAICKKRSVDFEWPEKNLKQIEIDFIEQYASSISPFILQKVSDCFISALQYSSSFSLYSELEGEDKVQYEKTILDKCYNDRFQVEEKDTLNSLNNYFVFGNWMTEKEEILEMKFSGQLRLIKKDERSFDGVWYLSDNLLHLKFDGFSTQVYEPLLATPNKFAWKNNQTGNYVRYSRIIDTEEE